MRYTFLNDGGKEALFRRCYRRFQIQVGALVAAIILFCVALAAFVRSHGVLVVLGFSGVGIGFALIMRSVLKRDGIDGVELYSYIVRQPMMRVAMIILAISVVVSLVRAILAR
jgi:hypothetical protein